MPGIGASTNKPIGLFDVIVGGDGQLASPEAHIHPKIGLLKSPHSRSGLGTVAGTEPLVKMVTVAKRIAGAGGYGGSQR